MLCFFVLPVAIRPPLTGQNNHHQLVLVTHNVVRSYFSVHMSESSLRRVERKQFEPSGFIRSRLRPITRPGSWWLVSLNLRPSLSASDSNRIVLSINRPRWMLFSSAAQTSWFVRITFVSRLGSEEAAHNKNPEQKSGAGLESDHGQNRKHWRSFRASEERTEHLKSFEPKRDKFGLQVWISVAGFWFGPGLVSVLYLDSIKLLVNGFSCSWCSELLASCIRHTSASLFHWFRNELKRRLWNVAAQNLRFQTSGSKKSGFCTKR